MHPVSNIYNAKPCLVLKYLNACASMRNACTSMQHARASMRHARTSMWHARTLACRKVGMLMQARNKVPNACLRTLGQLSTQQACSMLAHACRMHAKRFQMHVCCMLAKKYAECMPHACETCVPLWFGSCHFVKCLHCVYRV